MAQRNFDYIIVGGGSAGCVMANRLSARSGTSVLLLEAGQDAPPGQEPTDILDTYPSSYYNKSYMWPALKVHWRERHNSPATGFDQGRIIGGGSSVMGMVALRGTPDDYDEWERLGASGWGWDGVLPYFRRLEHDLDFSGDLHGDDGPTPRRSARTSIPSARKSSAGPMPARSSIAGVYSAPAQRTISRAPNSWLRPSIVAATPVARGPSNRSFVTVARVTIVRFARARTAASR